MSPIPWHSRSPDEVLAHLDVGRDGLDDAQARRRLERHGPNRLAPPQPVSALAILVDQFRSVVVALLFVAAAISLALGDRVEAIAIAAVLVINTSLGFVTELRARRAMEALLELDVSRAMVVRSGRLQAIDAAIVVPGDVVRIDAGQSVPADARLIEATDLRTDEAPLTGESLPVSKHAGELLETGTPLAERTNMVYKSTTVVGGTGIAVVTETGAATEVGRIGVLVGRIEPRRTPLEQRLDALGRRLVWLALGVAALVAVLGALQGVRAGLVIQLGIALAVAAVPEALPVVATIALAVGVRRMARRHALIRRLPAVEALGSTTVVCTDKTRTLTSGRMTVVRLRTADQEFDLLGRAPRALDPRALELLEIGALASRPQPDDDSGRAAEADPVDLSLLAAARGAGIDRPRLVERRPQVGLVPFSSERKFMVSFHRAADGVVAYVKGAPRHVLDRSRSVRVGGEAPALGEDRRRELLALNDALAGEGLRVLGLASGPVAEDNEA
jgi:Ca2+-transporting ATPase